MAYDFSRRVTVRRFSFVIGAIAGVLFASGGALAQTPATNAYDIAQLSAPVQAAVESARQQAAEAEHAAEQARDAALIAGRRGSRDRDRASTAANANGLGIAPLRNGDTYAGSFVDGVFHGFGVYTFAEGATEKYEGAFDHGLIQGVGVYTWRSGGRYAGPRINYARDGAGVYVFPDGRRYEGQWVSDSREGLGVEWTADGRVRAAGLWRNNEFVGPAP